MHSILDISAIPGLAAAALAFAVAALGATGLSHVMRRRGVVAQPSERSNHTSPTPFGGGIAVLLAIACGFGLLRAAGEPLPPGLLLAALLALGLGLLSWLDDVRDLSPAIRLPGHLACALAGLGALPEGGLFQGLLPDWLDMAVVVAAWVWFTNLYNFMDGIDGITGTQTASLGSGLALLAAIGLLPGTGFGWPLAIAAAGAGFLVANWHPARIFMGDVGSVPLGFLLGWFLLSCALQGAWAAALILPLYYLCDATITLMKRAWRREPVWRAHRQHFYQRAALATGRHDRVTLRVAAAGLVLLPLAMLGEISGYRLAALGLGVGTVALLLAHLQFLAGRPGRDPGPLPTKAPPAVSET